MVKFMDQNEVVDMMPAMPAILVIVRGSMVYDSVVNKRVIVYDTTMYKLLGYKTLDCQSF